MVVDFTSCELQDAEKIVGFFTLQGGLYGHSASEVTFKNLYSYKEVMNLRYFIS